ncbi:MAG: hypothetical protein DMF03_12530 [Verrucomicrobia bacterium]|nr:MAG: hypothetical protein DMF03_12530 [Verrucomicrobiota bacterium]
MLHRAQGTDFSNPDTTQVSIGTVVRLRDVASSKEESYTILGAWDGDPERHVISYQTAIAQALLGKKPGERVTLNTDHGMAIFELVAIEAAPREETRPDLSSTEALPETAVAEVAAE